MRLDKLLWSQAKADILKFLIFKKEGVSARALENHLNWTFPSIKKQIEVLESIGILDIDKSHQKREIFLQEDIKKLLKKFFQDFLEWELQSTFKSYPWIQKFFLGKVFNPDLDIDVDLVLIYSQAQESDLEAIKHEISAIFDSYFINNVKVVFFSQDQFELRYKMADKFVLSLLKLAKDF